MNADSGSGVKSGMIKNESSVFYPKYFFTSYMRPLVVLGYGAFILFECIQRQDYSWVFLSLLLVSALVAFLNGKEIIREIEFSDESMTIHYFIWPESEIEWREIKSIQANVSIKARRVTIPLTQIRNRMELQNRVAIILSEKKILNINIEEEIIKGKRILVKRLKYTVITTTALVLLAISVIRADLATWAFLIFMLFFVALLIFSIFLKA
jgi:hypothetical protein